MTLLDRALKHMVKRGTLTVREANGKTHSYGTPQEGWPDLTLTLNDSRVAAYVARHPRVGMAEAFMDGRISLVDCDILTFVDFMRRNNPWERDSDIEPPGLFARLANHVTDRIASRFDQVNRRSASRAHVAHHYDIGDRLYELFLDDNRQYSCGYWDEGVTTLEQAQVAKMDHIAAKLALEPGMRVLDIGCGWGGLAMHLHRTAGVRVHGVTLSTEQIAYAKAWAEREGVDDAVTFSFTDYRDVTGPFDRIVSVGMFEHVGRPNLGEFFRACHDLLAQDGVMLIHTIGRIGPPGDTDAFTRKYIFPGGYIPALSETALASERHRLLISDVEVLRLHYARTIREWYKRCTENRERIVELYDKRFYRMWTFYLAGAATAFECGDTVNFQLQYLRARDTLPVTRNYIHEVETAYRQARGGGENVLPMKREGRE